MFALPELEAGVGRGGGKYNRDLTKSPFLSMPPEHRGAEVGECTKKGGGQQREMGRSGGEETEEVKEK